VAPTQSGRLIFADADGFGILDPASGEISRIADTEKDRAHNRFNDGKVDRAGRFWGGTMDNQCLQATGSLYRVDRDLSVHCLDSGFICSNGIGWSPDNQTMYFTDSMVRTIWAYEFDLGSGAMGPRRVFAQLSDRDGYPDGLTVDSEGFVWSAVWDGWRLIRYAPDGAIEREIRMPVQRPSSCMFGDPDLKTLFITSACVELGWSALKEGPLAGGLFALRTRVAGLPEMPFGAC
jgi:sugar lactone lactonase YvrE